MDIQSKIFSMCVAAGFPVALSKLIVCQAVHETGNFTSDLYRDNNNLFGYTYVKGGKWQTDRNTGHYDKGVRYAYYGSVEDSINEIIDYYKRRIKEGYAFDNPNLSILNFTSLLKKAGYYADLEINYRSGVQRAYTNILHADLKATLDGVTVSMPKKKVCSCCGQLLV